MSSAEDTPDVSCQVKIRIVKTLQEDLRVYRATVNKEYITKNHLTDEELELKDKLVTLEKELNVKCELNENTELNRMDNPNGDSIVSSNRNVRNSTQDMIGARDGSVHKNIYNGKNQFLAFFFSSFFFRNILNILIILQHF